MHHISYVLVTLMEVCPCICSTLLAGAPAGLPACHCSKSKIILTFGDMMIFCYSIEQLNSRVARHYRFLLAVEAFNVHFNHCRGPDQRNAAGGQLYFIQERPF